MPVSPRRNVAQDCVRSRIFMARADLQAVAVIVRQRSGNLSYDAAVNDALASRLLIAERWHDQAALTAHLDAPETEAFIQRWQGKMRGEIRKYDASNERDLMAD